VDARVADISGQPAELPLAQWTDSELAKLRQKLEDTLATDEPLAAHLRPRAELARELDDVTREQEDRVRVRRARP
jgi:hypothetical protein